MMKVPWLQMMTKTPPKKMMMMAVPGKQSSQNGLIKDVLHTDPRESGTLCVRIRFGLPSQGPGKWDPVLTRAKNMFKNVPEYQKPIHHAIL